MKKAAQKNVRAWARPFAILRYNQVAISSREDVMAKGQMRSNKEKKKPKADHNKKKKGGPPQSPFGSMQSAGKPAGTSPAKKA
ncbi:MAG TPA: hypothetical protein VHG27_09940 [Xanthobacteraceae bacterium]|nr:hypothetical protein [Xanthobacteraceae bacterium]